MNSRVAATNCFLTVNRRTTSICVLLVIFLAPISRVDATDKLDLAIQRIESLGGEIKRDDNLPGRPVTEIKLGQYFDENARHVFHENADLLRLFTNLTTLNDNEITDAGLKELCGFKNLKSLDLGDRDGAPGITDAGLRELSGLKNLESLSLEETLVTVTGLNQLKGLKNLKSLRLRGGDIFGAGIMELRKTLPNVRIHREPGEG